MKNQPQAYPPQPAAYGQPQPQPWQYGQPPAYNQLPTNQAVMPGQVAPQQGYMGSAPGTAYPQQPGYLIGRPVTEFGEDLFGCFNDLGSCVMTLFCPCLQFGINQEKATQYTTRQSWVKWAAIWMVGVALNWLAILLQSGYLTGHPCLQYQTGHTTSQGSHDTLPANTASLCAVLKAVGYAIQICVIIYIASVGASRRKAIFVDGYQMNPTQSCDGLPGGFFCTYLWCYPCAICQEAREINRRGPVAGNGLQQPLHV